MIEYNRGYYALTDYGYYLIFDDQMEPIDNGYDSLEDAKDALDRYFG